MTGDNRYITVVRAEREWVERARKNPLFFIEYVTEHRPARHHREWVYQILDPSHRRDLIIAPREAAKTTILVNLLAWLLGKAPWTSNGIVSVSANQSRERLRVIKDMIQHNVRFRNVFPWIHIDQTQPNTLEQFTVWSEKWTEDSPNVLDYARYRSLVYQYGNPLHPTMFGAGSGSSAFVGKRFSGVLLVDDPHDAKNSATEDQRDKFENWFNGTLLPTVQEEAELAIITTRWAETDIAGRKMQETNGAGAKIWRTHETKAFDRDGNSYWPEFWPVEKLERKRDEVGPVMWELMYMNNPLGMAQGEFKLDMLRRDLPNPMPELRTIVISTDLAVTTQSYSDWSVAGVLALDGYRPSNLYLLDMIRGKWDMDTVLAQIARLADQVFSEYGRLDAVLFEKQSFQTAWADKLRQLRPDLPIKLVPIKGDKAARLSPVALKAQAGRFYVNQSMPWINILQSELMAFPKAQNDDTVDTVSLPFQYWQAGDSAGIIYVRSKELS